MVTRKFTAGRFGSAAGLLLTAAGMTLAAWQRRLEAERSEAERSAAERSEAERLQAKRVEREEVASLRQALAHQQRMHWELLTKAIDDPSLAPVIDTYDKGIPAEKRRQFLYANAWYAYMYHSHRAGLLDREELYRHMRELLQSQVFRDYWEASRHMRATLNESSEEAQLGLMIDGLVQELDDAETDEWWVVGNPPTG
ncbi:DUF6082 family protein [Streptomyces sp. NPDC049915]|uniref:DUF6082 family protein n=1 Tax=Streptomyces sp. NPDC049915 TaxID=3155510 RepID=UPI0034174D1B